MNRDESHCNECDQLHSLSSSPVTLGYSVVFRHVLAASLESGGIPYDNARLNSPSWNKIGQLWLVARCTSNFQFYSQSSLESYKLWLNYAVVTASFNLFQHSQYCQVPIRNWWRIAGCLRGGVTPGTEARQVEARDVLESWSHNISPKNKQIKPIPRSVFIPTISMCQNAVTNFWRMATNFWRMARIVHEFNSLKLKFLSANCHEFFKILQFAYYFEV